MSIPVLRLLGPDPIYNFEAQVRDNMQGVYSLEPAWLTGRNKKWINWMFTRLTDEDALGVGYAQVGQENGFLWENIKPGLAPQLDRIKELHAEGKVRVETMGQSATWFKNKYRVTPPVTFQASYDWWEENDLSTQIYASNHYRLSFLGEKNHLRIRDWFLYDENYESRYLHGPMKNTQSFNDVPPVLFPQIWKEGGRPFIRFLNDQNEELTGDIRYWAETEFVGCAELTGEQGSVKAVMNPWSMELTTQSRMVFDKLPVFESLQGNTISMVYEGFSYSLTVSKGTIVRAGKDGVEIRPVDGTILLTMGEEAKEADILTAAYLADPQVMDTFTINAPVPKIEILPFAPEFNPGSYVFTCGETGAVELTAKDSGVIRYTLDGTEPNEDSPAYAGPIELTRDTVITARLFADDGRKSEAVAQVYRFCLTDMVLESDTKLDWRPVFSGNGLQDLLGGLRGTTDYLDFAWRGGLESLDITCTLPEETAIASIGLGCHNNHRSGLVYPESITLWLDEEEGRTMVLPNARGPREITIQDFVFEVHKKVKKFRILAKRFDRMPEWCAYHGTEFVFTMADKLLVVPEE